MKRSLVFGGVALLVILCFLACEAQMKNVETVKEVDLQRYAGTWYEIARFPHRFEKRLVGVTATYTLRPDGKIDVLNQGYRDSLQGKLSTARAVAKIPNPDQPGRLKVFFFPLFGADYSILELDRENYQYVLVGSSSPGYLWILSRTPQMAPEVYEMLVAKARQRGYDVSKLQRVEQPAE